MNILFVHQNFPGQYAHLAPALSARGHVVHALHARAAAPVVPGVKQTAYALSRGNTPGILPLITNIETKILRAQACAEVARKLAASGFKPDVLCIHPGWGEGLFLRDIWPDAPQIHFVEYWYQAEGQDVGFDPEFETNVPGVQQSLVVKNLSLLSALHDMDAGVSPTRWQADTVPAIHRDRLSVIHDGIDTARFRPDPAARFQATTQAGLALDLGPDDEVVSFVNRNLEPQRGYHRFMRALPAVLSGRPRCQVVLVGGNGVSYSAPPQPGLSYQQIYLDEIAPCLSPSQRARIHFVGRLPHASLIRLYQVTRAHVYLSYPFVLSWSLLEAMSCGAPIIASDTAPVREFIQHGVQGVLVDFFDTQGLAAHICERLESGPGPTPMGLAARQTICAGYSLHEHCLPRHVSLVEHWAQGGRQAGAWSVGQ